MPTILAQTFLKNTFPEQTGWYEPPCSYLMDLSQLGTQKVTVSSRSEYDKGMECLTGKKVTVPKMDVLLMKLEQ